MAALNLALRFLLELFGLAAVVVWGWTAGGGGVLGAVLAATAAMVLVTAWALVVAPKSRNRIPQATRVLIGTGALLAAACLLAVAGHAGPAAGFALVNVLNTVGLVVLGGPAGVGHADRTADPSRRS
jgi:hypothetical protein